MEPILQTEESQSSGLRVPAEAQPSASATSNTQPIIQPSPSDTPRLSLLEAAMQNSDSIRLSELEGCVSTSKKRQIYDQDDDEDDDQNENENEDEDEYDDEDEDGDVVMIRTGATKFKQVDKEYGQTQLIKNFMNIGKHIKEEEKKDEETKKETIENIQNQQIYTINEYITLIKEKMPVAVRMQYVSNYESENHEGDIRKVIENNSNPKLIYKYLPLDNKSITGQNKLQGYMNQDHFEQYKEYILSQKFTYFMHHYKEKGIFRAKQLLTNESRQYSIFAGDAFINIYNRELCTRVFLYMLLRKRTECPDKAEFTFMGFLLVTQQTNIKNVMKLIYADEQAMHWVNAYKFNHQ